MTMRSKRARSPEKRRIAADEAHSWARNLQLDNPLGKLVLCMLTQYVNGDGVCYVGIVELAKDCELAQNTIRSRLEFLEQVGAIIRQPRWLDEYGRRNGDGHGKRTTDDIKLLIDAEIDLGTDDDAAPISPSPGEGLTSRETIVSPSPALHQPFTSVQGLISEPEPEDSPKVPSGDVSEAQSVQEVEESEPEHFGPAWVSWRGHEVMRRDLGLAEFRKLSIEDQRLCRAAIPQFFQMQDQLGRKHPPNFHIWVRNRGFAEFPTATLEATSSSATSHNVTSREGRAIKGLYGFARVPVFEHRGEVVYPLPITAQVLAFADLSPQAAWHWIEDRAPLAAWNAFLAAHIKKARPSLITTRGEGENKRQGFWAPWPWPPRKDGSISPSEEAGQGA